MTPFKPNSLAVTKRPFLITFSGIDGAGKTTQIEQLSSYLEKQGLRVLRLSYWDNIAVWSKMRAGAGHVTLASRHLGHMPGHSFAPKNNKHVRKWYLTAARWGFYLLDVARLCRVLASERARSFDVVIFDRYIYDQIANIDSQSPAARIYSKILLRQSPPPDLAFVLDASPAKAFARKPEYPLDFVYKNRRTFLLLQDLVPRLIIISEAQPEEVASDIYFYVSRSRLAAGSSAGGKPEVTGAGAVARSQISCSIRNHPTPNI
jgi:thymidylate kinase